MADLAPKQGIVLEAETQIKFLVASILDGDSTLEDLHNEYGSQPALVREVERRVAEAKGSK